jgi:serine kinase of HPr protein (carbohydrate metabolism regulator)
MQAILVADDQVEIFTKHNENNDIKLYGQAPASLAGLLEVRHLGIKTVSFMEKSEIHCAIKLKKYNEIERLPEDGLSLEFEGQSIPLFFLDPFEPSALNKLNLILNEINRY